MQFAASKLFQDLGFRINYITVIKLQMKLRKKNLNWSTNFTTTIFQTENTEAIHLDATIIDYTELEN